MLGQTLEPKLDPYLDPILDDVQVLETEGPHPVVFGSNLKAGPKAPTVLIYGHYDVQV